MEERVRMLSEYDTGRFSVSELCGRYGISRDTFYFWRARRLGGEQDWFLDRSHATQSCPHCTPAEIEAEITALRERFPYLGPRKLLAMLERQDASTAWPSASTIGDILKRAGLIAPRKGRRKPLDPPRQYVAARAANEEWAADYKGWFRTQDQRRIDPLTISDSHTRYLIETRIADVSIDAAKPVFARAFSTYGLPLSIRCDNGAPFGSQGAGGLTRLSVWWLKLGIEPHFITPASPQENGRHERMHRTLKAQTSRPAAANAREQQARFDAFRRHYNEERPHEAIGQKPPAALYTCSARVMPKRVEDPWYDADHQVRRVRPKGEIKWNNETIFIGEAIAGELVGIAPLENGDHIVRFATRDLGIIQTDRNAFRRFAPPRTGLREPPETHQNLSTISPVQFVGDQTG